MESPGWTDRRGLKLVNAQSYLYYGDDVETVPADEAADIQRVVEALSAILERSHVKSGQFQADVHVKTHGYAQGEFRVLPNLPEELAQGLFAQAGAHPAVVRFSNSAPYVQPDAIPDGRGLAIKVLGVSGDMGLVDEHRGPTQDFVMVNYPVFFVRNVKDYLRVERVLEAADDSALATIRGALTDCDWNPVHWHWKEALSAARIAGQFPVHPASTTYYSMAPIRFGNYVAKYRVVPAGGHRESYLDLILRLSYQADAMRLALEESLRDHEISAEFQVQLRTSEQSMPIEDATVEWPESESPYRTVAHLVLPQQDIAGHLLQDEFRSLAFHVWHALAAHRPLGGVNRVRSAVYPISAAWRRRQVGLP